MEIKIRYAEPAEYIPEDLRKLYKLGEYAEPKQKPQQEPQREPQQERELELRQSGEGERQQSNSNSKTI